MHLGEVLLLTVNLRSEIWPEISCHLDQNPHWINFVWFVLQLSIVRIIYMFNNYQVWSYPFLVVSKSVWTLSPAKSLKSRLLTFFPEYLMYDGGLVYIKYITNIGRMRKHQIKQGYQRPKQGEDTFCQAGQRRVPKERVRIWVEI